MEIVANWKKGVAFDVVTETGAKVSVDGPVELGGTASGARPMELMLASVATCSGIDVVNILTKGKRSFDALEITVHGQRAKKAPAVFTSIDLHFKLTGCEPKHAQRAVDLSVTKYCSALKMLEPAADINWSIEA